MNDDIFLWEFPDEYPENLIGEYEEAASPDRFLFQEGRTISVDLAPLITFEVCPEDLKVYGCLASTAMVPLVSSNIAAKLMSFCPEDVQMVKARILANGSDLPGYSIVNALHKVKAIDHDNSVYSIIPGTDSIMGFQKLAVLPGALGQYAIARDEEYLSHLLVNECCRDLLIGAEGIGLYRPEEMSW